MRKFSLYLTLFAVLLCMTSCGGSSNGNSSTGDSCEETATQGEASTFIGCVGSYIIDENGNKTQQFMIQFWKEGEEEGALVQRDDIYDLKGRTIKLGEGDNASYQSCTECVTFADTPDERGDFTKFYFATSGEIRIEDVAEGSLDSKITATSLHFEEIDMNTGEMVENGKCFETASFEWNTIPSAETPAQSEE